MAAIRIVLLCMLAAIAFGIAHDQVTVRVCLEYFTIGHPKVLETNSPTLLALVWGVLATWWVGLGLGLPLAAVSRWGARPKRGAQSLVEPIAVLLGIMCATSLLAGLLGYLLASNGSVFLVEPLASRVPEAMHVRYLADLWAHSASYLAALIGGMVLIWRVWRARKLVDGSIARRKSAHFRELQVVVVSQLIRLDRQFDGTKGIARAPRVGDVGTICHSYDPTDAAAPVSVECVDPNGMTVWVADFQPNEIQLANCAED
jgi:hypothetical protein